MTAAKDRETETETATEAKPLTKAEEVELFTAAHHADQGIAEAEALVASAKKGLDEALKAIAEKVGCGPFDFKGRKFRIGNKNGAHFYKSLPQQTVRKIGR